MKVRPPISLLLFGLLACTKSPPSGPALAGESSASRERSATDRAPRSAGKPAAPFSVGSSVQGVVAAGVDLTIPLTITPHRDCTKLTTVVRGLEGVAVRTAGTATTFATCVRGAALAQSVIARVLIGGAGYVIVDVQAVVAGRAVRASYSIPLRAEGAEFTRHTLGDVVVDPNGERVIKVPATEP